MTVPPEATEPTLAEALRRSFAESSGRQLREVYERGKRDGAAAERDRIRQLLERQASEAGPDYAHTLRKFAGLLGEP